MSVHPIPDPDIARALAEREPAIPEGVKAYTRVEGLLGEEARLLATAKEERRQEHEERLREVTAELDRIWERLRERAEQLGARGGLPAQT
jgi:hypothetical protein